MPDSIIRFVDGSAWEATPSQAVQRAAWAAVKR